MTRRIPPQVQTKRTIDRYTLQIRRLTSEMTATDSRKRRLESAYEKGHFAGAHDTMQDDPRGKGRWSPDYQTSAEWIAWRDGWLDGAEAARAAVSSAVADLEAVA